MSKRRTKPADLAEQLRQALRDCGHTQYEISKGSGIDRAMLVRFLTHERDIRMKTAGKLAAFLGLELVPVRRGS